MLDTDLVRLSRVGVQPERSQAVHIFDHGRDRRITGLTTSTRAVNAGGLHYYRVDAAVFEPIAKPMKVACKSAEAAYGFGRASGTYRSHMHSGADINSSRIRMHRRPLGMLDTDLLLPISALLVGRWEGWAAQQPFLTGIIRRCRHSQVRNLKLLGLHLAVARKRMLRIV